MSDAAKVAIILAVLAFDFAIICVVVAFGLAVLSGGKKRRGKS